MTLTSAPVFGVRLATAPAALALTPAGAESPLKTGLSNTMAAIGGRGVLSVRGRGEGLFELALRSDAQAEPHDVGHGPGADERQRRHIAGAANAGRHWYADARREPHPETDA